MPMSTPRFLFPLRLAAAALAVTTCSVGTAFPAFCASAYADADNLSDTRTRILDRRFRTLQVKVGGNDMLPPVVELNSGQTLTIEFDEIGEDRSYLRYELIHCNSDWKPSGLIASEFLDGFNEATVDDYAFSRATLTHYVHYTITIPNPGMRLTVSGNYLVRIYDEEDPETTLLQVRIYVNEATMRLEANASSLTDIDRNMSHQQVDVTVDVDRVPVRDMWSDLRLVVEQNGRPDMARTPSAPLKVFGSKAYFEHRPELIFPAGNEYRRMEVISTRYTPMGVAEIGRVGNTFAFYLNPDFPRSNSGYTYDSTQHGRFRVREYDTELPDTEADYVAVYFSLESPELPGGDIFIDGDLTNRLFDPESRMVYNRATGAYEAIMYLKQGAYNYQYLFVPTGSTAGSTAEIEGDYAPTGNEYTVRLYYRAPGERYDRLAAATVVTLD